MQESFHKIFWGFLFVLVEIHIIAIDILPDPLGYFFIFLGVQTLAKDNAVGKKSEYISLILIILSIPTIFIQNSSINEIELVNPLNVWSIYMIFIGLCKLILVFFVFKLMLAIANENEDLNLIKRTTKTFNIYIVVMLFNQIVQSFMMNMTRDILTALTLFMLISSFILEITFLVLLRKFRNMENRNNGNPLQNSSQIDTKV